MCNETLLKVEKISPRAWLDLGTARSVGRGIGAPRNNKKQAKSSYYLPTGAKKARLNEAIVSFQE